MHKNINNTKSYNKKLIITILIISISLLLILAIVYAYSNKNKQEDVGNLNEPSLRNDFIMDTIVSQQVYGEGAEETAKKVYAALVSFEEKFSMYKDDSEITKLNEEAGKSYVKLSDDTYTFLKKAKELSKKSLGVFDITIAPLTKVWNINHGEAKIPSDTDIKNAMNLIDCDAILFNDEEKSAMLKNPNQAIDLGGIAKGYSTVIAKEIYENSEISSALISIGGNIYTYKTKPNGKPYKIGIRDPRGDDSEFLASIEVTDEVVATSGDYERYFELNGKRYHHILDPRTGQPAETDLISVSIISKDGTLSDFLSTTMFILGKDILLQNKNNPNFDYIAVDKDMKVYISENIKEKVLLNTSNNKYKLA